MRTARRVFWNTAVLLGADAARLVVAFLLTPIIARVLGGAELGKFTYVMALIGILGVMTDFGLSAYYIRQAQQDRGASLAGAILGTRALLGILVAGGLAAYALTISDRAMTPLLLLGSLLLLLGIFPGYVTAALRARELMGFEAVIKVAGVLITTAGGVAAVLAGRGIAGVMWVQVGFAAAMLPVAGWLSVRYTPRPSLRLPLTAYTELVRGAWPFALLAILAVIYFRIDSVMLYAMKGQAALGQYGAAYRLMEAGLLIPLTLAGTALPSAARLLTTRTGEVVQAGVRAIHLLGILSIPAAVLGAVFAAPVFRLLYGQGFEEAAGVFAILAFTLIAVFASAVTSSLITASPRPEINTYIAAVMVVLNIGLNALLIPRWSGAGAAAATVATETAGLVMGTLYIRRRIAPLAYEAGLAKPALAAAIVGAVALRFPVPAWLPLYAVAYLGLLWIVRGLTREDVDFLRWLIRRPGGALMPREES